MKHSIMKLLATPILAAGFCALVLTGCGKGDTAKNEVTLDELNRAVSVMFMAPAGAPKNFSDLTNFPAFQGRPLPTPPAGKKFAIDSVTRQIVVADP